MALVQQAVAQGTGAYVLVNNRAEVWDTKG